MKYQSEDYFSVVNKKTGKKICDCSDKIDALMMVSFDLQNRIITRNQFLMGQVVDIEIPKQLPTNEIVVAEKEIKKPQKQLNEYRNKLTQSDLQPVIL